MLTNGYIVLLLATLIAAKQEIKSPSSPKDLESAGDQVTSILVHQGPTGPRHVVLSNDHQILPSGTEGFSSRNVDSFHSANYPLRTEDVGFHHTVPPPLRHVTYGPARPVALRGRRPLQQPGQLYHHRFALSRPGGKIPHLKAAEEDSKGLSEAIYKYSTYIKHGKNKENSREGENEHSSRENEAPDYSVTIPDRDSYARKPQHEGLSSYREHHRIHNDEEEIKFRESIGDLYENDFEHDRDRTLEKKPLSLPYSKLYFTKQHNYIPNNVNSNKYYSPNKAHNTPYNDFDDESYHDKPSGFDDTNGGKVVPLVAKFYKQPLPIIHTQLPADNVGLFVQYFPQRYNIDREELSSNGFEQYPQEKSSFHRSDSEWTPINAPDGAVPAKSYDIPAPDLSLGKITQGKVFRRGSDSPSVVLGKSKQRFISDRHIQGNSEGVVSAVVRVKQ